MNVSSSLKTTIFVFTAVVMILAAGPALAAGGGYSETQVKDFFYRVMNFAVFFGVLFYLLRKPLPKFFRDRREAIAQNLEYLETQARNLQEQTEILNKQIAGIASERDSILAQYERMGQKEADRIIAEAKIAADNIIHKTEAAMDLEIKSARLAGTLDLEIKSARQALLTEIVKLSTVTATELVKGNINNDDQKRLTGEFMAQVEKLGQTTGA